MIYGLKEKSYFYYQFSEKREDSKLKESSLLIDEELMFVIEVTNFTL